MAVIPAGIRPGKIVDEGIIIVVGACLIPQRTFLHEGPLLLHTSNALLASLVAKYEQKY